MSTGRAASPANRFSDPAAASTVILICCALSSGVHVGLAPEHLAESSRLGAGFLIAAAMLLAAGLAVFVYPQADVPPLATALVCAGLLVGYAASRTVGLPGLEPEREAPDAIGLITQIPQLIALVLAPRLYRENRSRRAPLHETRRIGWTHT